MKLILYVTQIDFFQTRYDDIVHMVMKLLTYPRALFLMHALQV